MGVKVIRANAQKKFYDALSNENDPEAKRKIIGQCDAKHIMTLPIKK
jgi:GMP synthase (glutamine-hydrolysing)